MSTMFKVFIGNLSFKTTEDQIRKLFEPHCEVDDVVIARDPKTERPMGYGFIMIRDAKKGRQAIYKVGKPWVDGRAVYLKEAHGKRPKKKKARVKGSRPMRRPRPRPAPAQAAAPAAPPAPAQAPTIDPPASGGGYMGEGDSAPT